MKGALLAALCVCFVGVAMAAGKPVIYPGGAVNAAGLVAASQSGHGLAPGSIASLFGQNLAASVVSATGYPLQTTLGGTSVIVDGAPAPLFYVSPGQINFQVPSSVPGSYYAYGQISIVVTTAAGSSDPIVADGVAINMMIFALDGSGCGPGAVLNVADGRRSMNSASNSVSPGDFIEIYGTGLGQVYNPPPDGAPALSDPLSKAIEGGGAVFNFNSMDGGLATFAGRAPGLVGVDQIDVPVPSDVREGCAVPLQAGGPPVTISIHSGGGQCVDPPIQSAGTLTLKKSVVMNDSTMPETDSFSGSFSASPGKTLPPPPPPIPYGIGNFTEGPVPSCPIPGYSTPDAGVITIGGPALPPTGVQPATANGGTSYQATLPAGSIAPGTYQIAAVGGNGIGAFQGQVIVGRGIQVTSQFPQGQQVRGNRLVVNWTGGQPGEAVTVRVVDLGFYVDSDRVNLQVAPATAGTVSFDPLMFPIKGTNVEIDVQVGPDPSQPATFTASGLTLGGQITWMLEYRFTGLSI